MSQGDFTATVNTDGWSNKVKYSDCVTYTTNTTSDSIPNYYYDIYSNQLKKPNEENGYIQCPVSLPQYDTIVAPCKARIITLEQALEALGYPDLIGILREDYEKKSNKPKQIENKKEKPSQPKIRDRFELLDFE